jgi:hypothetical protein
MVIKYSPDIFVVCPCSSDGKKSNENAGMRQKTIYQGDQFHDFLFDGVEIVWFTVMDPLTLAKSKRILGRFVPGSTGAGTGPVRIRAETK